MVMALQKRVAVGVAVGMIVLLILLGVAIATAWGPVSPSGSEHREPSEHNIPSHPRSELLLPTELLPDLA